jgi:hypothetical protein
MGVSDGMPLRSPAVVNVWYTDVEPLGYVSALVAAPVGASFLRMPLPHVNYAVMHACDSKRRLAWMSNLANSETTARTFSRFASRCGLKKRQIPFGAIAYLGHDMGREEQWAQGVWPGWFRVYALPLQSVQNGSFVAALGRYIEAGEDFTLRPCEASSLGEQGRVLQHDDLTSSLFVDGVDGSSDKDVARFARLLGTIDSELAHPWISIPSLSPGFQPQDCRLWLANVVLGQRNEHTQMLEELSARRARLIRVLGWPLFVDVAAGVLAADAEFPSSLYLHLNIRTDVGDVAVHELSEHVAEVRARFPELTQDPLNNLYG